MSSPGSGAEESREAEGMERGAQLRGRLGLALIGLGMLAIMWAVLYLNVRALGGSAPGAETTHRRSYDQVKSAAHRAFPGFALRGGVGFALILVGAHLRARGRD